MLGGPTIGRHTHEQRITFVLVDDVCAFGDALNPLVEDRDLRVRVVAADRTEALRSPDYDSTAFRLRRASSTKIALAPDTPGNDPVSNRAVDYRIGAPAPGRGFLLAPDENRLIQT
ncbi:MULTISPECIES: hypothetical protein [unclassified Pseudofrankia]|uniref:hypothetical protein n=1 Tax=unclassified Pseudofrankia TaxID=2994372 RepID=UPI0008DB05F2|nr:MULTISPECIES: hypothetical protein [unclassified Pseudofrankia]MDT3446496.1 hypothetical protein [Pseudofrankia sp. BMG5.37]OHV60698.1 hypothetical protein BCD48_40690 [Pseudofrankia sp. BMG5.36]